MTLDLETADKGNEYTLAQHQAFLEYVNLFEGFVEGFLAREGVSSSDFYELVRVHLSDDTPANAQAAADKATAVANAVEVLGILKCVADFNEFAARMCEMNEERKQRQQQMLAHRGVGSI